MEDTKVLREKLAGACFHVYDSHQTHFLLMPHDADPPPSQLNQPSPSHETHASRDLLIPLLNQVFRNLSTELSESRR